jgi:hypothetical protein
MEMSHTKNMMLKTYSCAMVKEVKNNPAGTWKSMPSYRESNRKKCTPCVGMEKGYFTKTNNWFKIYDSKFHQCRLQQDDKQCKLDD